MISTPSCGRILETAAAEIGNPGLRGDDQHRHLLGIGGGNAGYQVGGAGAGGGTADPDPAACPGIAVGDKGRSRFMTGKDRAGAATPFAARQGIKERAERAAGDAEDVFHAELLQIINDQIAQGHKKPPGSTVTTAPEGG